MSSTSRLTADCYLTAVKELLKQRGVTYGDLAKKLKCSLPTVKRALNKTTLPLDRLLEIAEIARIDFVDVCKRAERLRPRHFIFTDEQDALFAERPELLGYIEELLSGKTPGEIERLFDLDRRSTSLYQIHLERVGLIKRKPRRQVQLLVAPPVGFGPGSLYLKREMEEFLTSVVSNVVHADGSQRDRFALLKPLSLTTEEYKALVDAALRLVDQYAAIGERRAPSSKTLPWQIAIACAPGPKPKSNRLPRITA